MANFGSFVFEMDESRLMAVLNKAVESGINLSAEQIKREAKERCPVDTGNLRGKIDKVIKGNGMDTVAEVGTNVEYAEAVEFGTTSPTVIVPKTARVLAWKDKRTGEVRFAKRVVLPPRQGRPFLTPAYNKWKSRYKLVIANELTKKLGEMK